MKGFGEKKKTLHQKKISNNNKIIKDRIINKAFSLHSQGNISEAKKYYENFIKQEIIYSSMEINIKRKTLIYDFSTEKMPKYRDKPIRNGRSRTRLNLNL